MNFHNYIFIGLFSLFLFSSKTRATAFVLLFAYFVYYNFALKFHGLNRFMVVGTIEVVFGLYLVYASKYVFFKHQDISIAETYFLSVFVNVAGGCLYWDYYPAYYYDNMCITIMVLQILILTWRILKGGRVINRCSSIHPIFGFVISGINKRYSLLQSKKA